MTDDTDKRVMLTWAELKKLGWPYSRTHTVRKMQEKIEVTGSYGKETRIINNPDPFPAARKLGWHRHSPLVWVKEEVFEYFRRHGIPC